MLPRIFLTLGLAAFAGRACCDSGFTTSDFVHLRVADSGAGEALLFVPGWRCSADIWHGQRLEFEKSWRVLSLDPRGQGDSDKNAGDYSTKRRARDLSELLKSRGIPRAVVVGWSLGALEALQLAASSPSQVRALVLVDNSVDRRYQPKSEEPTWLERFSRGEEKPLMREFNASLSLHASPEQVAQWTELEAKTPRGTALSILQGASSGKGLSSLLRSSGLPVLYLVRPEFEAQALALKKDFPWIQIEIFRGAGHALFLDEPARFNALLSGFLKSLP